MPNSEDPVMAGGSTPPASSTGSTSTSPSAGSSSTASSGSTSPADAGAPTDAGSSTDSSGSSSISSSATKSPNVDLGASPVDDAPATPQITLPVEVIGAEQTTAEIDFTYENVENGRALWLQVNNLSYQNKASVQINGGRVDRFEQRRGHVASARQGSRRNRIGSRDRALCAGGAGGGVRRWKKIP